MVSIKEGNVDFVLKEMKKIEARVEEIDEKLTEYENEHEGEYDSEEYFNINLERKTTEYDAAALVLALAHSNRAITDHDDNYDYSIIEIDTIAKGKIINEVIKNFNYEIEMFQTIIDDEETLDYQKLGIQNLIDRINSILSFK